MPNAQIVHVGATALAGGLTKGDLDLCVRVPPAAFEAAEAILAGRFARNEGSIHTRDFAAFEDRGGEPPLGVQLTAQGGAFDDFLLQRDALLADVELHREYTALKRRHSGHAHAAYREDKDAFFTRLGAGPLLAAARPGAEHRRKLERMYLGAPINRYYQPDIAVGPGAAVITFEARADMHHAAGGLHGSCYFKALDDAAFFAAASLVEAVFVLTASFHISLLRPVRTGVIRATGRVVRAGAITVCEATLSGPDGSEVARGVGDFAKSKIGLAPEMGYL
jgi:uncharacterized protein (TIGR00369 family)